MGMLLGACAEGHATDDGAGTTEAALTSSTGGAPTTGDAPTTDEPTTGEPAAPTCAQGTPALTLPGALADAATIDPGGRCHWTLTLDVARVVALRVDAGSLRVDDRAEDEPGWQRPRELAAGTHTIVLDNPGAAAITTALTIADLGPSPPPSQRARSLVWTQPELIAAPQTCGLACLMGHVADDGHGGRLLRQWFDRFATTTHSERLGPKAFLDEFAAQQFGAPPELWDLAALPFTVTAVHSRLDLRTAVHCGELRVSLASTHPIYRPFHLIFLFAQPPVPEDISPAGALHCTATALRWARLGERQEPEFAAAAQALIGESVTGANFLAAESVEFTISPWEWRQWFLRDDPDPLLPRVLDNRPLFQTVDTPRLNAPGPTRDAFLAWVTANAPGLLERRTEIPEEFRPLSARVNQGVPWDPLVLTPELDATYPDLRRELEIVGCPACHATDAAFVQTLPNHTFSPFYDKELDARAAHLDALARGTAPQPPFGPLQAAPLLPP